MTTTKTGDALTALGILLVLAALYLIWLPLALLAAGLIVILLAAGSSK